MRVEEEDDDDAAVIICLTGVGLTKPEDLDGILLIVLEPVLEHRWLMVLFVRKVFADDLNPNVEVGPVDVVDAVIEGEGDGDGHLEVGGLRILYFV